MTQCRITHNDHRAKEVVQAESASVEGPNGLTVLRTTVTMARHPREVVVRRVAVVGVRAVDQVPTP